MILLDRLCDGVFFITYDSYKSSEELKFLFNTGLLCYFRCCQYDSWLWTLKVMFPVFSSKQDQVSRQLHAKCISLFGMTKKLFFLHSTKQKQRSWVESAEATFC